MNITSSRIQSPTYRNTAPPAHQAEQGPADSFTFSGNSGLNRLGKGVGGGVAGTLFSGLLLSLPLSLAPALGADTQTALTVYSAACLTLGVAGGLASAAMPPGKDWY
jgi:predicted lipid-binding transport protein (Tim44 family)